MKKILIILLAIAGAYGCLEVSGSVDNFKKVENQDMVIDNVPVHIQTNGKGTQKELKQLIAAIQAQPDYLKNKVQNLYLANSEDLKESCSEKIENYTLKTNCSLAYPDEMAIYISTWHAGRSEEFATDTVSHEMWHIYDFYMGDISQSEEFSSVIASSAANSKVNYAGSAREVFAEAGSDYINEPDVLKERYPVLFNYFESLPK